MADATVTAGRGVLYIAMAKAYFMVAGYAIVFTLPRLLDSVASWGNYTLVVATASVIDNVIVTGTIQAVSRFTAQSDDLVEAVKRASLKVQLGLGGLVALTYFAVAPLIASLEKDHSLTDLYRLSAGIVLCYAFYAVFVGSLNGQRLFGRQATLDVGFATLRAALILGCAAAGLGVFGAVGGFVAAAAVILLVSAVWVGLPRRGGPSFEARRIWAFMAQMFVYNTALNLITRADLFLLKRFAGGFAGPGERAAEVASIAAGYYGSAQYLAFIPYQAILAVAFVIFPLVSRATFDADLPRTQSYIRQTLRLSLIFVAGLAVVLIANAEAMMRLPFPDELRFGWRAMQILAGGMVFFSLFTIVNTILNGAGRTSLTIRVGALTLAMTAGANALLIPRAADEIQALSWAAIATSCAVALGTVLASLLLYREFRAGFLAGTLIRVVLAMAVAVVVGRAIPEISKLVTVAESIVVFASYLLVLILSGEIGAEDARKLARVLRRGQKGKS